MDYGFHGFHIHQIHNPWISDGFGFMDLQKMDYGLDMDYDFNPSGPTVCIGCLNIPLCNYYLTETTIKCR